MYILSILWILIIPKVLFKCLLLFIFKKKKYTSTYFRNKAYKYEINIDGFICFKKIEEDSDSLEENNLKDEINKANKEIENKIINIKNKSPKKN